MALRIEKAFGVSMDTLMRMQNSFDIAQTASGKGRSSRAVCGKAAGPHSRPESTFLPL